MTDAIIIAAMFFLMLGALARLWLRDRLTFFLYALGCGAIPAYVICGSSDSIPKKVLSMMVALTCSFFVLLSMRRRQISDENERVVAEKFEKWAILSLFAFSLIYILLYGL